MRRKSERAVKKTKSAPEVEKAEKPRRARTRRNKKQSSSSENESADEESPVIPVTITSMESVEKTSDKQIPKEENSDEKQDQVWLVKTSESSADSGEIQKLKICLARPPSTPERVDKSPRSKRKHTRTTSSSDTPSENTDEKKKVRRSKRSKESDGDRSQDSQGDEADSEPTEMEPKNDEQQLVHTSSCDDNVPMSTTDDTKIDDGEKARTEENNCKKTDEATKCDKMDIADNTVDSSVADSQDSQPETTSTEHERSHTPEIKTKSPECAQLREESHTPEKTESQKRVESSDAKLPSEEAEPPKKQVSPNKSQSTTQSEAPIQPESPKKAAAEPPREAELQSNQLQSPKRSETPEQREAPIQSRSSKKSESGKRSVSPKSSRSSRTRSKRSVSPKEPEPAKQEDESENEVEVELQISHKEEAKINEGNCSPVKMEEEEKRKHAKENKKSEAFKKVTSKTVDRKVSMNSDTEKTEESDSLNHVDSKEEYHPPSVPFVINRKRKWGSRPHKLTAQKSLTISTDILKDIIPDVKPVEFEEVLEKKKHSSKSSEKVTRPILPKIVIDNTTHDEDILIEELPKKEHLPDRHRRVSLVNENDVIMKPLSPPRNKSSSILYISNLVRPFTLLQLKNLLQRTGRIVEGGFWIDKIKSKCYVKYETEDQAIETRHALHGVTWPISNPKTLQVDFSNEEAFDVAKNSGQDTESAPSAIPGTVEDWLLEQDMKRKAGELEKPWQRKTAVREWDVGKGEDKEPRRTEEKPERRRHRTPEFSPEPVEKKFKKKEEEVPAKLLDDLFKKTKHSPCIYWLPLSDEMIAIKEEQRRKQLAEHERRMQEMRRQRRH